MMRAVNEIVASTAAAEREAERLRDELAALEEEQATLEAELAVFEADYLREVVTVLAELYELEARIAATVAKRSGTADDKAAARDAPREGARDHLRGQGDPADARPAADRRPQEAVPRGGQAHAPRPRARRRTRGHAEAFMKRLNQAFAARDEQAIVDLVRQWESSPYATAASRRGGRERARRAPGQRAAGGGRPRAEQRLEEVRALRPRRADGARDGRRGDGTDLMAELRAASEAALAAARVQLAALEGRT